MSFFPLRAEEEALSEAGRGRKSRGLRARLRLGKLEPLPASASASGPVLGGGYMCELCPEDFGNEVTILN